jgi:hypothetical protein
MVRTEGSTTALDEILPDVMTDIKKRMNVKQQTGAN